MIEVNDKNLKLKREELVEKYKLKTSHKSNYEEYEKYAKKLDDAYIIWLLDFGYKLNKELDKLSPKDYITLDDYKVSPQLKDWLVEAKRNIEKDIVKDKLSFLDYNSINMTFLKLSNINKLVLEHNADKFIDDTLTILKNRSNINNIKLLNKMINLYKDYIQSHSKTHNVSLNYYNVILFLKKSITKYGNIEGLIKEYENIVSNINNKLSGNIFISQKDIKELKRNISLYKDDFEKYNIFFNHMLYSNELEIIKNFRDYNYNLDNISFEHNTKLFLEQYLNIFKERNNINNIKLLNNLINLYENCIKPYSDNNINSQCINNYNIIILLKEVVNKFGSIQALVKEFENIMLVITSKLNDYTVIYKDEDIKELKRKLELSKLYNENYNLLFCEILYSNELQVIKTFNNYVNNLDNIFYEHNENAIKLKVNSLVKKIKEIIYRDKDSLLKSLNQYEYNSLKNREDILKKHIAKEEIETLKDNGTDDNIIKKVESNLNEFYHILSLKINEKNARFIEREKNKFYYLFNNIEGKKLDNQQIEAIIKNEENSLTIAGAGSGKTITIIGKILYILEKRLCKPEEILVISFTNTSSDELRERVKVLIDDDIQITNFHKLGLSILNSCDNLKFNVLSEQYNCIFNIVHNLFKYNNFKAKFEKYIMEYYAFPNDSEEFETYEERVKFLSDRKDMLYTIKGEKVKSFEEKQIANFLYLNGIRYIYEEEYKYDTRTKQFKKQYKPDFYLCDYDIYLEHFGVDKNGEPPWFYSQSDCDKYKRGMKWKENLHKANKTKLITTYSWEYKEGKLLERLQQKLLMNNVKLNKIKMNELSGLVSLKFKDLILEIQLIINIIKIKEINIDYLYNLNKNSIYNNYDILKNSLLLGIVNEIYIKYCNLLNIRNEIDYSDMIRKAREIVEQGKFNKKYKYIIIDEYQDISPDRVKLIKALKKDGDANLFCVGDDWQSIYGFAGSNIDLFINFEDYYGPTIISKIENTYRFGKDIISVSESFIQKNEYQNKKKLNSPINKKTKIDVCLFNSKTDSKINVVKRIIENIPKGCSVLILDRYDDLDKYNKPCLEDIISKHKYKLNIEYRTIHTSKGLESDYVLVLNNDDSIRGFPSQKDDEKLVNLALERKELYPFEEERRLFYVAITRAKKNVFLIVDIESQSQFIKEITGHKSVNIHVCTQVEEKQCDKCKIGKMQQMKSDKNKLICSNYPYCDNIIQSNL